MKINIIQEKLKISDLNFANECLNSIDEEQIILHYAENNSLTNPFQLINTYKVRFEIEKNKNTRTTFGYEILLQNLELLKGENKVKIFSVFTDSASFTIFTLEGQDKIVGILKSLNSNISEIEKLILIYKEKELSLNYFRYFKGELIETIKN